MSQLTLTLLTFFSSKMQWAAPNCLSVHLNASVSNLKSRFLAYTYSLKWHLNGWHTYSREGRKALCQPCPVGHMPPSHHAATAAESSPAQLMSDVLQPQSQNDYKGRSCPSKGYFPRPLHLLDILAACGHPDLSSFSSRFSESCASHLHRPFKGRKQCFVLQTKFILGQS